VIGSTWNDIVGQTAATVDVTALYVATPFFRAKVSVGGCDVFSPMTMVTDMGGGATIISFQ
jgi:hypothetical protein